MTILNSCLATAARVLRGLHAVMLAALVVCGLAGFGTALGAFAAPSAWADEYGDTVAGLAAPGFAEKVGAIEALALLGDDRATPVLQAMSENRLYTRKDDGRLVIGSAGRDIALTDAVTGEALGTASSRDLTRINVNNALRSALAGAIGRLQINNPDPAKRLAAAETMAKDRTPEAAALLREALDRETVEDVRAAMALTFAKMSLGSPDAAERLAAVNDLSQRLTPEVRALVTPLAAVNADGTFAEPDARVRAAAADLLDRIDSRLAMTELALNLFQGISLGSVLLLAAIGLAITFGVMGVINMAHGEMIMLGAYTTVVVQQLFREWIPADFFGLYLILSIPAAFLVAGAVGVVMERGIIRFLYGRPLETLLATWGISLMLQQAVRAIFGAPNKEVSNPGWMTGAWEAMPGMVLTYNRIAIILFAFAVLAGLAALLRYTPFGLQMRAVTQNRNMASAMGIRTGWVDALTFGLGSGIAGVAGVALSQIGNVSPNLGQGYIVDSFMVVVFGGVGSLWGVLAGAMTLGIFNKFLEPYAGAMLGKILILVFIILFIQKRPRGLFALKGRAAEA
ncbi:urea ABC transporter permease subunit UrtB [Skermanella mucosa]|uniref:urea ABC transporter permease subunit UrtB n=1 Tax=Skermanella mucosa TaxID=1789672 RepID=UPI001E446F36|nr:urea ABC transporter permease subunit UrtB [Skermanella mucosa]UEM22735.1 urea ABC transporter permease subunit UrtB [Skermanella mucosa]